MTWTNADMQRAASGSHRVLIEARLVAPGQSGPDPDGITIEVTGGDVQYDATADIYASASTTATIAWPRYATDPGAPYGAWELWLRRGIDTGGGEPMWAGLGYFRLDDLDQAEAGRGPVTIGAPDRMAAIIDARFLQPRLIPKGSVVGEVFRTLAGEALPAGVVVEFDDPFEFATLGRDVVVKDYRYQLLRDLAKSGGKIMHFDGDGVLQVRSAPLATGTPTWEVAAGPGGVLINAARSLSRATTYNIVVARGQGADATAPVQAIAADLNPDSPTYVHGNFGPVPRIFNSPLITDDDQAYAAAVAMLRTALGMTYEADYQAVPNPAVRPWDIARLTYDTGDRELHALQTVTVPLDYDTALSGTTREQTRTLIRRYTP